MAINWAEVNKALSPIKDYEDLCKRYRVSFGYLFVCAAFNFSMFELVNYTQRILEGEARGRYTEYAARLVGILTELHQAGVQNILDLASSVENRAKLETFTEHSGVSAQDTVSVMKYLVFWFFPAEKYRI